MKNKEDLIVLTGGMGSGKSYVSNLFLCKNEEVGFRFYNADMAAKRIQLNDAQVKWSLQLFFDDVYGTDEKTIDSHKIFEQIRDDEEKLDILNKIIHPAVFRDFLEKKFVFYFDKDILFVMENAIHVESGLYKLFDFVIYVSAPLSLRKERIMKRPGMTEEKMEWFLKRQLSEEETIQKCSKYSEIFVIKNDKNDNDEYLLKEMKKISKAIFEKLKKQ